MVRKGATFTIWGRRRVADRGKDDDKGDKFTVSAMAS